MPDASFKERGGKKGAREASFVVGTSYGPLGFTRKYHN